MKRRSFLKVGLFGLLSANTQLGRSAEYQFDIGTLKQKYSNRISAALYHFNLKISQYNKIFLRKKLLKMKAVYPYKLRLLTIFNQKNKVRLAKFKITNF